MKKLGALCKVNLVDRGQCAVKLRKITPNPQHRAVQREEQQRTAAAQAVYACATFTQVCPMLLITLQSGLQPWR